MIESQIYMRELVELGCHPKLLFARFFNREIVFVLDHTGRMWHRRIEENCETFAQRVIRDICERENVAWFAAE